MPQSLDQIRSDIAQALRKLGADSTDTSESILIRNGFYCGRRFRCDGFEAVWFIEEKEIKLYDASGALAAVLSEAEARREHRAA